MKRTLAVAVLMATGVLGSPGSAGAAPHTPCEYEDSVHCVWDGRHMGNGEGKSFISNRQGVIKFISHKRAHRLLFG